jgi:ABC-type microcin C transport system permease subunit YejB
MDWITLIVFLASIPLAGAMARARGRSFKAWLWISVLIGPLAPLALAILGQSRDGRTAPAN